MEVIQLTSLSVNIRVRRKDLNTQFRETLRYSPQTIQALLDISVLFAAYRHYFKHLIVKTPKHRPIGLNQTQKILLKLTKMQLVSHSYVGKPEFTISRPIPYTLTHHLL